MTLPINFTIPFIQGFALYLGIAGGYYLLLYFFLWPWSKQRRIQDKKFALPDLIREILFSISHMLLGTLVVLEMQNLFFPKSLVYSELGKYGYSWLIFSFFALFLFHDSYFYWTHRALHHPLMHRLFHRVHHSSTNPPPFASFCFHPIESFLHVFWAVPLFALFPVHTWVMLGFFFISALINGMGHCGIKFLPPKLLAHPMEKFVNSSRSHNFHHQDSRANFSLYFRFWGFLDENQS